MKDATRALLVITQSEMGGAQQYVRMVATGMLRQGITPVVACGGNGELVTSLRSQGIEVHVLPSMVRPIRPLTDIRAVRDLVAIMHKGNFDIVHCNSTKAGIVGRVAARLARVPLVFYTIHGCVLNEPMSRLNFLIYWGMEFIASPFTTRMIAVSHQDRDAMIRYRVAPASRITVIENGIDPGPEPGDFRKQRSAAARARLGLADSTLVVGTTANFYPTKALDVLIRSMAIIAARRPDVQLVIVGDGAERPMLERLVDELGLKANVSLPGQIPDARELLPAFDIFALSSRKEGLPLALLEAMAAGLPVVVTDAGGMANVVEPGTAGVVVPREDPDRLAQAILDILGNPRLATRLGQAARARVASIYTEERMVSQTIDLYRLESSARRGARMFPGLPGLSRLKHVRDARRPVPAPGVTLETARNGKRMDDLDVSLRDDREVAVERQTLVAQAE